MQFPLPDRFCDRDAYKLLWAIGMGVGTEKAMIGDSVADRIGFCDIARHIVLREGICFVCQGLRISRSSAAVKDGWGRGIRLREDQPVIVRGRNSHALNDSAWP